MKVSKFDGLLDRAVDEISGYVRIRNARLFRVPIPIRPLVEELAFITNKAKWGLTFREVSSRLQL